MSAIAGKETVSPEELKKRHVWQCRRGIKENEVMLERYLHEHFLEDTPEDQALFGRLLEAHDAELFEWFTGRSQPQDAELDDFIHRMLRRMAPRKDA